MKDAEVAIAVIAAVLAVLALVLWRPRSAPFTLLVLSVILICVAFVLRVAGVS
jgi:hypothetical protein